MAVQRDALRLYAEDDSAHYRLAYALEHKHNFREALQEYRTAYELDPQNPSYRRAYERLLKREGPRKSMRKGQRKGW